MRFLTLLVLLTNLSILYSQTISGSISGSVVDSSGNVIPAAPVRLLSERTGEERTANTNESGDFMFPALQPGSYTVIVEVSGFRPFRKTGNALSAAQRLSVGSLALAIGSVSESVTVAAQSVTVQTGSTEHSALIGERQLEQISIRGRDVVSMLRILPGVSQTVDTEFLGGSFGTQSPNIQGTRSNWNSLQVDGVTGNDLGSPGTFSSPINMDAIGEVKVLMNNYQAEYGRNGASSINVVTKSGSREYHGTAYWYKRHESWNANNFFNNRTGVPLPIYRYSTLGATLGGPVPLGKVWNGSKEKLFFFYSFEKSAVKNPQAVRQVTVPTALERAGDFSQTVDLTNKQIIIRDPLTNAAFPGNVIPANRLDKNGQAMLNIFPLPNQLNRAVTQGNFNYQFQEAVDQPRNQHLFRIDIRPTAKDSLNVRGSTWYADSLGYAVAAGSSNWGLIRQHYTFTDNGIVLNWARILTPRMVNEFTGGVRHSVEKGPPESDEQLKNILRKDRGLGSLGQFYPGNNPFGIIPQASYGGVTNAAAITYDGRFPLRGADTAINFSNNLTYTIAGHTLKAGIAFERIRNYEGEQGTYGGSFAFARDVNNPFDSNYAYSNAVLGNFQSYQESAFRPSNEGRKTTMGWFLQDTWKVTRKLTLDYGMRFVWFNQWYHSRQTASAWDFGHYDRKAIPALYSPILTDQGRRAVNPLNGDILPAVYIGAFVPNSGNPFNGAVTATDPNYPRGFRDQAPVQFEPRFGIAYDPFGDGRTAIRTGFGIFHNTVSPGVRDFSQNPPTQQTPQVYYGNLSTYLNSTGVLFPNNVVTFEKRAITPSMMNFTFGIQRDVGRGTVVELSYVGNVGRHLQMNRNLNLVPYGARYLPQNADPANPSTPLPDNFFRPYPGWGNINYNDFSGNSNYNAFQTTVNRRFAKGLSISVAYTYSKAMGYADSDGDTVATYRPLRVWNYGKLGYDQTHMFVTNYIWDLPRGSRILPNRVGRLVLDKWQVSGISTFASGQPSGVTFTTVDTVDLSGGGDGTRINVTGKAPYGYGDRSFSQFFNTNVFARPAKGDPGNAPKDVFRLPGTNNWDISFFKFIPLFSERKSLQLRWEMYNAFNHTQFNAVDSVARFDASGNQVNARFGSVIGARNPRRMQASLRFRF
ncbi:carboxypeptidase regulatory-like domain-containing protein [Bryobacter aggregatus]|uniref:carboxypeptidase regulatory-like domain-containing protein n=1 Tax=Bryobacter aggregatus TaxID=360054 RepID=UPI0004E0B8AA|nr:carboxypeptidase regulatory-like domain-containing protein [Bryobacter aggregatus]